MRTSAWLRQSSWWVLATEICPSQLWTSRWLARSSSPTQMKMKTGTGEWKYESSVVQRALFYAIDVCFMWFYLWQVWVTDMWSFIGFKLVFRWFEDDNSLLLWTVWQQGGVSDTLVVFLCTVGDFFEIVWKWHKHTLTVSVEPTDSCTLWALVSS